jgi:hypothetical protein
VLAFSSHPFVTAHQPPPGGHPETTAAGDNPRVMGGEQRTAPGVGGGWRFLGNGLCGWARLGLLIAGSASRCSRRAGASRNVVGPCLEGHVVGDGGLNLCFRADLPCRNSISEIVFDGLLPLGFQRF